MRRACSSTSERALFCSISRETAAAPAKPTMKTSRSARLTWSASRRGWPILPQSDAPRRPGQLARVDLELDLRVGAGVREAVLQRARVAAQLVGEPVPAVRCLAPEAAADARVGRGEARHGR